MTDYTREELIDPHPDDEEAITEWLYARAASIRDGAAIRSEPKTDGGLREYRTGLCGKALVIRGGK